MLRTAKGQTALELSTEFISAMSQLTSGSEDMDVLFDTMLSRELDNPSPKILNAIKDVNGTGYNAWELPFLNRLKIQVTPTLYHWICSQSRAIPDFITTMLGFYATVFYNQHPASDKLTLRWVSEQVGRSKLVTWKQFFPWYSVARMPDGVLIFDKMEHSDLYTYTE